MGVHRHGGTMPDGVTPICNECGIALCWDIDNHEYSLAKQFWDDWICQDCNGGTPLSRAAWKQNDRDF